MKTNLRRVFELFIPRKGRRHEVQQSVESSFQATKGTTRTPGLASRRDCVRTACFINATIRELKSGDPRTDHPRKGTTRTPGLASRRDCVRTACFINATVRELKGGRPKTRPSEEGDDSDPVLGIPKRLRPYCLLHQRHRS